MSERDYFDDVADLLAASWTVGRWCGRDEIVTALRKKYKTEAELREEMDTIKRNVMKELNAAEADGFQVVGIAQPARKEH